MGVHGEDGHPNLLSTVHVRPEKAQKSTGPSLALRWDVFPDEDANGQEGWCWTRGGPPPPVPAEGPSVNTLNGCSAMGEGTTA